MNCKKCNSEIKPGDAFCPNCGEKVEVSSEPIFTEANQVVSGPTNVNIQKKNKTPIIIAIVVAAVLLLVGVGVLIITVFPNIINKTKTVDLTITSFKDEIDDDFEDLSEYHKQVVWKDTEVYTETKFNVNVYDDNKTKLFELNAVPSKNSTFLLDTDVTIKLNNGETVLLDGKKPIDSFDFYYFDNMLIFNNNGYPDSEEYYLYNYDSKELFKVFSNKDKENEGFAISNILYANLDNPVILFYAHYDTANRSAFGTAKQDIAFKIENNFYTSIEQLEQDLTDSNLEDFDYIKLYNYEKKNKEISTEKQSLTVKEYFRVFGLLDAGYATDNTTKKECTGTWGKTGYEYSMVIDDSCSSITYNLEDKFNVKYDINEYGGYKIYTLYVNGALVDAYYETPKISVVGNTLITREYSTDLGAHVYLINKNGEAYNLSYQGNEVLDALEPDAGFITKSYSIDTNGDLKVVFTRHDNRYGEYIGNSYLEQQNICSSSFDELINKYGVSNDYAYMAEYTYGQNADGLYTSEPKSINTTLSWKDYYNNLCRNN
jgi:flagellar basal body-associated protein FliL